MEKKKHGVLILTLKPLLLNALDAVDEPLIVPQKVADVSPGQLVAGYIVKVKIS